MGDRLFQTFAASTPAEPVAAPLPVVEPKPVAPVEIAGLGVPIAKPKPPAPAQEPPAVLKPPETGATHPGPLDVRAEAAERAATFEANQGKERHRGLGAAASAATAVRTSGATAMRALKEEPEKHRLAGLAQTAVELDRLRSMDLTPEEKDAVTGFVGAVNDLLAYQMGQSGKDVGEPGEARRLADVGIAYIQRVPDALLPRAKKREILRSNERTVREEEEKRARYSAGAAPELQDRAARREAARPDTSYDKARKQAPDPEQQRKLALMQKHEADIPDIENMRAMGRDIAGVTKNEQKANRIFLERMQNKILLDEGFDKDTVTGPQAESMKQAARQEAVRRLISLHEEGSWAYPLTQSDLDETPPSTTEKALRALAPQREVTPSGRSARTEPLGWWAMNVLGVPLYATTGALTKEDDENYTDAITRAIARREGMVEATLEMYPDLGRQLTSGDAAQVSKALGVLALPMAFDATFPDLTMATSMVLHTPGLVADLGRISARVVREAPGIVRDTKGTRAILSEMARVAKGEAEALKFRSDARAIAELRRKAAVLRTAYEDEGKDIARAADWFDEEEAATRKMRGGQWWKEKKAPPVSPAGTWVRTVALGKLYADPDVALYLSKYAGGARGTADLRAGLWKSIPKELIYDFDAAEIEARDAVKAVSAKRKEAQAAVIDAERAAGRPIEPGVAAEHPSVKALDAELAAAKDALAKVAHDRTMARGQAKAHAALRRASEETVAEVEALARGERVPEHRVSHFTEAPPEKVPKPDVDEAFPTHMLGRVASAETPADLVRALRYVAPEARERIAAQLVAKVQGIHARQPGETGWQALVRIATLSDEDAMVSFGKLADAHVVHAARLEEVLGRIAALSEAADARQALDVVRESLDRARTVLTDATKRVRNGLPERVLGKAEAASARAEAAHQKAEAALHAAEARVRAAEDARAHQAAVLRAEGDVAEAKQALRAMAEPEPEPAAPAGPERALEELPPAEAHQRAQRYGSLKEQTLAAVNEPYTHFGTEGLPSAKDLDLSEQKHLWGLTQDRVEYGLTQGLWTGEGRLLDDDMQGIVEVADHLGLPVIDEKPTRKKLWTPSGEAKPLLKRVYEHLDKTRKKGLETARSWNLYLRRTILPQSDTTRYRLPPDFVRLNDAVTVRNPKAAADVAGTFPVGGVVGDGFMGRVVGFADVGGVPHLRVEPQHFAGGSPRRVTPKAWEGRSVLVPLTDARYYERGRYFLTRPRGRGHPVPWDQFARFMDKRAWFRVYEAERADTSGLARKLRYTGMEPALNPPRLPTKATFDVLPEDVARIIAERGGVKRAVPFPKYEGVTGGAGATAYDKAQAELHAVAEARLAEAEQKLADLKATVPGKVALDKAKAAEARAFDAFAAAEQADTDASRDLHRAAEFATNERVQRSQVYQSAAAEHTRIAEEAARLVQAARGSAGADERLGKLADQTLREKVALREIADEMNRIDRQLAERTEAQAAIDVKATAAEARELHGQRLAFEAQSAEEAKVAKKKAPGIEDVDPLVSPALDRALVLRALAVIRQGQHIDNRTHPAAVLENIYDTLRTAAEPAGEAAVRSLSEPHKVALLDMDGRILEIDQLLAEASKNTTDDLSAFPAAMDVLREYAQKIRAARQLRKVDDIERAWNLAALAYFQPDAPVTKGDVEQLIAVLDDWVLADPPRPVEALRAGLFDASQRLGSRLAEQMPAARVWQEPQVGDIYLANVLGKLAAEHMGMTEILGDGAAMPTHVFQATAEWLSGTDKSALGLHATLAVMENPHEYASSLYKRLVRLRGATKEAREPLVSVREGHVRTGGLADFLGDATAKLRGQEVRDRFVVELREMLGAAEALDAKHTYIPRAVRDRFVRQMDAIAATWAHPALTKLNFTIFGYWKQAMTVGLFFSRPIFHYNNKIGDFDAIASEAGIGAALRTIRREGIQEVLAIPGVAQGTAAWDALWRNASGTTARRLHNILVAGAYGTPEIGKIMDATDESIRIGTETFRAVDLHEIARRYGLFETYESAELTRQLGRVIGAGKRGWGISKLVDRNTTEVRDISNLLSTRRRIGLFHTLIESGMKPEEAARLARQALYDYKAELHPFERGLVQIISPFWVWSKSNTRRTAKALLREGAWHGFGPTPGWRMKTVFKLKQDASSVAGWYLNSEDEHGFDVASMAEEPDPNTAARMFDQLVAEHVDPEEAERRVWAAFEAGKIQTAYSVYEPVVTRLMAQGFTGKALDEAILADPALDGLVPYYYAPNPVRTALPSWAQRRIAVMWNERKSRALDAWDRRGVGVRENIPDAVRFAPFPDDSNLAGLDMILNMAAATPVLFDAFVGNLDDGEKARAQTALMQVISDPNRNGLVLNILSAMDLVSKNADIREMRLPPAVGRSLFSIGYASRRQEQVRAVAPGVAAKEMLGDVYFLTPEQAGSLNYMIGIGPLILNASEFERLTRATGVLGEKEEQHAGTPGVAEGIIALTTGMKGYETSASKVAERAAREGQARVEEATPREAEGKHPLLGPGVDAVRAVQNEVARMEADPRYLRDAAALARTLYQSGEMPDTIQSRTLRALAVEQNIATDAEAAAMSERKLRLLVPRLVDAAPPPQ